MAKRKKEARVCVDFDGDRWCESRAKFLRANSEDPHLVTRVRALKVGQAYRTGGGAAPTVKVKRTR